MKKTVALFVLLTLTGCAIPTASYIKFDGMKLKLPKDLSAATLEVTRTSQDTNGRPITVTFKATKIVAKMNPSVISASAARDVALIQAGAQAAGTVGGQAGQTMLKP